MKAGMWIFGKPYSAHPQGAMCKIAHVHNALGRIDLRFRMHGRPEMETIRSNDSITKLQKFFCNTVAARQREVCTLIHATLYLCVSLKHCWMYACLVLKTKSFGKMDFSEDAVGLRDSKCVVQEQTCCPSFVMIAYLPLTLHEAKGSGTLSRWK